MEQSTSDIRSHTVAHKRDRDQRAKYNHWRSVNPGQATEPHVVVESGWSWEPTSYAPAFGNTDNPVYEGCKIVPGIKGRDLVRNAWNYKWNPKTCSCCSDITSKRFVSARKASRAPVLQWEDDMLAHTEIDQEMRDARVGDDFFDSWEDWDMDLYLNICAQGDFRDGIHASKDSEYVPTPYDASPLLDRAEQKWTAQEEKALVQLGWEDTWEADYWEQEEAEWSDLDCDAENDRLYGLYD